MSWISRTLKQITGISSTTTTSSSNNNRDNKQVSSLLPVEGKPTTEIAPSSDLWDMVLDMHWDKVIVHAKEHPQNAKWKDGHWDETPLYLACQFYPPPLAIRAIIQAYPMAVSIPSRENHDLPLHLACRYQAPAEVLEELVRDFPVTAVEQTRWGKTPLMVLWEFQPATLTEDFWCKVFILLNAVARFREDPKFQCQTPLTRTKEFRTAGNCISTDATAAGGSSAAYWCQETQTKNTDNIDDERTENNTNNDDDDNNNNNKSNNSIDKKYSLVHAAVSLGARSCPLRVLEEVMVRYPNDVYSRDKWGQLPLHIVVGPTSWSNATKRKYKPREQPFIERLLKADPTASRKKILPLSSSQSQQQLLLLNEQGRYPLHTALSNRHSWYGGVKDLFAAAPDMLLVVDPITKLYPFQLAAVPVGETTVDLDTIYHLLRSEPTVLTFFDFSSLDKQSNNKKTLSSSSSSSSSLLLTPSNPVKRQRTNHHYNNKKPEWSLSRQDAFLGTLAAISIGVLLAQPLK